MKKLSVVTVCYNSQATIENTIKSVISQKTDEVEYIIVDGKSTDSTLDIIGRYRDFIDIIISEKDQGISDAFNKGILKASGQYVALLNSDDQYLPGAFNKFLNNIKCDADVIYGNGIRLFEDGSCKTYMASTNPQDLHNSMCLVHPSTFVKRDAYLKWGMYDLALKCVMDRKCLLNMLNNGASFQYSDEYYSVYRMGGASDKQYLSGVVPESYRIDCEDGKTKTNAMRKACKRVVWFYLLEIRKWLKLDRTKRIPFEQMLRELNIE